MAGVAGRRSTILGTTLAGDSLAIRGGTGIGISATAAIGAAGALTSGGVGADCIVRGITTTTAGMAIITIITTQAVFGMAICGAVAAVIGTVAAATMAHAIMTHARMEAVYLPAVRQS